MNDPFAIDTTTAIAPALAEHLAAVLAAIKALPRQQGAAAAESFSYAVEKLRTVA